MSSNLIKKYLSATITSLFCLTIGQAQPTIGNYQLNVNLGLQSHDKRMFSSTLLVSDSPSALGTYYLSVSMQRTFFEKNRLRWIGGLGWALEQNNWPRPYNPCYPGIDANWCPLSTIDKYSIHQLQLPLSLSYFLTDRWMVGFDLNPSFWFHKRISTDDRAISGFQFYSLENYLKVAFRMTKELSLNIQFRFLQFRSIDHLWWDPLFLFSREPDTNSSKTIDTHNPLKAQMGISYNF